MPASGWLIARMFQLETGLASGCQESLRRTISIEVGMQNSGLEAALATRHFSQFALTTIPAAISAVYHCLIGSLLAAWWRPRSEDSEK